MTLIEIRNRHTKKLIRCCNAKCYLAKSPKEKCRCCCEGRNHGKQIRGTALLQSVIDSIEDIKKHLTPNYIINSALFNKDTLNSKQKFLF